MEVKGTVHKVGDNIDTDLIIAARYLNMQDPKDLAAHLMDDYDPQFKDKLQDGDIIVGGATSGGCRRDF